MESISIAYKAYTHIVWFRHSIKLHLQQCQPPDLRIHPATQWCLLHVLFMKLYRVRVPGAMHRRSYHLILFHSIDILRYNRFANENHEDNCAQACMHTEKIEDTEE